MPIFEYRGSTREGAAVQGTLQAANKQTALAELRGQGIWLTDLRDAGAKPSAMGGKQWSLAHALWPLSKMQISLLFRQLAALARAGVAPNAALTSVQDRIASGRVLRILREMAQEAGRGESMSAIFGRRAYAFGPFVPQMMGVGERTGRLDIVCDQIAQQFEVEHRIWRSLALQRAYMWVLVCFGICLPSFPRYIIQETFSWEHFADYGRHFATVLLPIILGMILGAKLMHIALSTPRLRHVRDWIDIRYPLTGPILRQAGTMRFLRTMSGMLEAGVPVADCLEAAAGATGNINMAAPILRHAPVVREGGTVTQVLHAANVFSTTSLGMIATGEESGTLPEALRHLAGLYETESDSRLARLRWISYVIVLLVGAVWVIIIGGMTLTAHYNRIFDIIDDMMP